MLQQAGTALLQQHPHFSQMLLLALQSQLLTLLLMMALTQSLASQVTVGQ